MFPEYRDLITQLKSTDAHFTRMFDQHDVLDKLIARMETYDEPGTPLQIEQLKKQKLSLKDEVYAILKKTAQG
jgi:uncharacterized protein YdcH (DUF465 family)